MTPPSWTAMKANMHRVKRMSFWTAADLAMLAAALAILLFLFLEVL
jgi:hypothetical protein